MLSRIIDELRTISLAEGRGLDLRPEPVEVASTLRRVAEGFRRAEEARIALEVDAPEALVVVADPERLRQMLGSLVDNAMRHTPPAARSRSRARPRLGPRSGSTCATRARAWRPRTSHTCSSASTRRTRRATAPAAPRDSGSRS